jgi:uncharacterized C2H2 Zn-finger protein
MQLLSSLLRLRKCTYESCYNNYFIICITDSAMCSHFAKQMLSLEHHILSIPETEQNFFCDHCPYSSSTKLQLQIHMIKSHLTNGLKCLRCATQPNGGISIEIIKKISSDGGLFDTPCTFPGCDKVLKSKITYIDHMKRCHDKERNFICPDQKCKKQFFTNIEMKVHFRNRHGKIEVPLIIVLVLIVIYIFFHSQIASKDFVCEICGSNHGSERMLKAHKSIHGEYKYACDYANCDAKFRSQTKLSRHVDIAHLGIKNYHCDQCGKSFCKSKSLTNHINVKHLGIRLNCTVPGCKSSLSRRDIYLNHLKMHKELSTEEMKIHLDKCDDFCLANNLLKYKSS